MNSRLFVGSSVSMAMWSSDDSLCCCFIFARACITDSCECNILLKSKYRILNGWLILILQIFIPFCLQSCIEQKRLAVYSIGDTNADRIKLSLIDWDVCGPFSIADDSLLQDSFLLDPYLIMEKYEADSNYTCSYSGFYHPLYNQLDLKEVYDIMPKDDTNRIENSITYLHCEINSDADRQLFLEVKASMDYTLFLNSDTLYRRDIQGLNIYPLHIKKGRNDCIVKTRCIGDDYSFDSTIYDSVSVVQLYADCQSCNIVYPQIDSTSHVVMLTNAHQNVIETPVTLQFYDVCGDSVGGTVALQPDSFTYYLDGLRNNISYICEMNICNHIVRQPVLCGKDDNAYMRFCELRKYLPDEHPRSAEIDQLLYRLNFLLNHPTRYEGDWWWQFKISPLTYQLEHVFAHLNDTYGGDDTEGNILFVTPVG